jgi:hypothetical protein
MQFDVLYRLFLRFWELAHYLLLRGGALRSCSGSMRSTSWCELLQATSEMTAALCMMCMKQLQRLMLLRSCPDVQHDHCLEFKSERAVEPEPVRTPINERDYEKNTGTLPRYGVQLRAISRGRAFRNTLVPSKRTESRGALCDTASTGRS